MVNCCCGHIRFLWNNKLYPGLTEFVYRRFKTPAWGSRCCPMLQCSSPTITFDLNSHFHGFRNPLVYTVQWEVDVNLRNGATRWERCYARQTPIGPQPHPRIIQVVHLGLPSAVLFLALSPMELEIIELLASVRLFHSVGTTEPKERNHSASSRKADSYLVSGPNYHACDTYLAR
jgi:hypothetical protein